MEARDTGWWGRWLWALAMGAACAGDGETTTEASMGTDSMPSTGETIGASADDTSTGAPADPVPKSLVIAIDGLRADALAAAETPAIDGLVEGTWLPGYAGAFAPQARCLTDAESYSGPNHWAIMTGAIGAQHGVMGNLDVANGDGEAFPHYLSLLERADPQRGTAYLFTWEADAFIPCEADYIRHATDADNVARVVGILDQTLADPDGDLGTAWARGTEPDAVFLFFDDVDHAGHVYGFDPQVPEYLAEIEQVDGQVGQILDALAAREDLAGERWQIIVTTDHGGIGMGHGGDSPEELTIPFLVASPDVAPGELPAGTEPEGTRNFDTVPTVLDHMGVAIPEPLTGHSRAQGS